MSNVIQAKRRNVVFQVNVVHAVAADENERTMWVATCDDLHLVTEHETYDGLIERVWAVAPDMVEANAMNIDAATMRLRFEFEDSAQDHPLAL
ncbi:MAG: DUF1902 domain-containing protein [Rhodanobacter sp.]|jgi:hypothetical protein|nr:DUF1902 domain-containing protein [Rhodanobacter sp.]